MAKKPSATLLKSAVAVLTGAAVATSLILGAELRTTLRLQKQVADLQEYDMAYHAFKLRFRAMPGDFRDAKSYWQAVENGDGDGRYEGAKFEGEIAQVFVHLSRAGLVGHPFDGTFRLGSGYPAVRLAKDKGMVIRGRLTEAEYAEPELRGLPIPRAAMYMQVARPDAATLPEAAKGEGILAPETLAKIDTILDDGLPESGRFLSYLAPGLPKGGDCVKGGSYNTDSNSKICEAAYIFEF